jgi:hypothetical protein
VIIHRPVIERTGDTLCVSARVELDRPNPRLPERLCYRLPAAFGDLITERADAFVVALLHAAMRRREPVEVQGSVSSRLLYNLEEFQDAFQAFSYGGLKKVPIRPAAVESAHCDRGGRMLAFSGGVDSFHALWRHLPAQQPDPQLRFSHALFVHGLDVPLEQSEWFDRLRRDYTPLLADLGLTLVPVEFNGRPFSGYGRFAFGPMLISVPLLLGNGIRRFYLAASTTYAWFHAWSTNPVTDHLLATESLEVLNRGAGITRVDRTAAIADWPVTYDRLRVCSAPDPARLNCCRCEKCLRTMVTLDLLGALGRYPAFHLPIRHDRMRRLNLRPGLFKLWEEVFEAAQRAGRSDIRRDLRWPIRRGRLRFVVEQLQLKRWLRRRLLRGKMGTGTDFSVSL